MLTAFHLGLGVIKKEYRDDTLWTATRQRTWHYAMQAQPPVKIQVFSVPRRV